ncbi:Rieske (2Fe-2S) protein [Saprospiraceae bacterium]|nr:Rieske (2Fe-2S) protein [Saprospiraceae bacterium]
MKNKDNIGNKESQEDMDSRRAFLTKLSIGLGGLGAFIVAIPVVGALFAPLIQKVPHVWRPLGKVSDFKIGETTLQHFDNADPVKWAGLTAKTGTWLRRVDEKNFEAFALNCAHLGCPVSWVSDSELFLCPCHGGVYYRDGSVASGPPPQGLSKYPVRVKKGIVEIKTEPIPISNFIAEAK